MIEKHWEGELRDAEGAYDVDIDRSAKGDLLLRWYASGYYDARVVMTEPGKFSGKWQDHSGTESGPIVLDATERDGKLYACGSCSGGDFLDPDSFLIVADEMPG